MVTLFVILVTLIFSAVLVHIVDNIGGGVKDACLVLLLMGIVFFGIFLIVGVVVGNGTALTEIAGDAEIATICPVVLINGNEESNVIVDNCIISESRLIIKNIQCKDNNAIK